MIYTFKMHYSNTLAAFMMFSSAVVFAALAPAPQPIEVLVKGQRMVNFTNVQCSTFIKEITTTTTEIRGLTPICPHLSQTMDNDCIRCRACLKEGRSGLIADELRISIVLT